MIAPVTLWSMRHVGTSNTPQVTRGPSMSEERCLSSFALLLHRVMRPKLTDQSPSAALRKLKRVQLHRLTAAGQTVRERVLV